ncbi:S8 family peptidase [Bradyrhizobium sp. CNPSo 4010]|uniref:S8 family peptidase n=2 Tax=Bradyrhizobium agreste TaxID=2751811 RepID=A0ABS0Q1W5_9BRAD|nr:S8 family peptidase [Bradyrhizobium agreste]
MAPERLLVFELTGSVNNFARAAARVPGLEFIGTEDLDEDDDDRSPVLYLLVPDAAALRQMLSLWRTWLDDKALPRGFTPWRDLFLQLREIRPWGPRDRVTPEDLSVLANEHADEQGRIRLEIELVFRKDGSASEKAARQALAAVNAEVISATRIEGAGYHALLAYVPQIELLRIIELGNEGLVAEETILFIRPQSITQIDVIEVEEGGEAPPSSQPQGNPIAAILDAVPLAGHPHLLGRLLVDDMFNLEPLSVGPRVHGTAMASAVLFGDLNDPMSPVDRKVHFVNVMYAPEGPDNQERFPNRLPADLFHEAIARMKEGPEPSAPEVIIVNVSLGDKNKPFAGQLSGWARVVDYLAFRYGLLIVISAGNHFHSLQATDLNTAAFEALSAPDKAKAALKLSGLSMASRRLLAPSEAINALTVGALHGDAHPTPPALPAWIFDVWADTGLCNISSALGPGYGGSTKPDLLAKGGRHHVRLSPASGSYSLTPLTNAAASFGGIKVAVPPNPPNMADTGRTIGTSVAAAITTGLAIRAHELLEAAYEDFLDISGAHRALLLKSLLTHCARWTSARDLVVEVIGPADSRQHVRQRDNVRRYLGYGAIDPALALSCANDRATLWAVGNLFPDQAHSYSVPIPIAISGKAEPHEIAATVTWFAPPRVGAANYRGARLKLLDPNDLGMLGLSAEKHQPDSNQSHRGTVIHRRWTGTRAAVVAQDGEMNITVQREPDEFSQAVPYAFLVTIEMAGATELYAEVQARIAVKPKVPVTA